MKKSLVLILVLIVALGSLGVADAGKRHKDKERQSERITIGEDCLGDDVCSELFGTNGVLKWKNTSVIYVADHSAPALGAYVQTKVQEWHAQMWWATNGRIAVVYSPLARVNECSGVPAYANTITVCSMTWFPAYPAGVTDVWFTGTTINKALVKLVTPNGWGHPLGCHELGHALGLNHPNSWNDDTCMSVYRDTPSPSDGTTLREKYG